MYETMTDYRQCGLAQAHPNNELINELSSTSHSIAVTGRWQLQTVALCNCHLQLYSHCWLIVSYWTLQHSVASSTTGELYYIRKLTMDTLCILLFIIASSVGKFWRREYCWLDQNIADWTKYWWMSSHSYCVVLTGPLVIVTVTTNAIAYQAVAIVTTNTIAYQGESFTTKTWEH